MTCLDAATIADHWFGDLPAEELNAVEEHLLGCEACSARLEELVRLRDGVHALVRTGALPVVVGRSFVAIAHRDGLRVREYAAAPGERVLCTVTPDDDLVIAHLRADLRGSPTVDLVAEMEDGRVVRAPDIPVDHDTNEVVIAQSMPFLRGLPTTTVRLRLEAGARVLGEYTFAHTAQGPRS